MKGKSIFRDYILKNKRTYLAGFLLLAVSSLLQLLIPYLLGKFTDGLEQYALTYEKAIRYGVGMTLAGLGIAFFRATSRIKLYRLSRQLEAFVRGELFQHWEKMSARYFNDRRVGDLMSLAISDVGVIRDVTMMGIFIILEAVVLITVTVIAMVLTVNPWLTLLTLLPLPLLSIIAYRFNGTIQSQSSRVQEAVGTLTSRVQEFVSGIRVVKSFVQEKEERELFRRDNQHAVNMNREFVRTNSLFGALSAGIVGFSYLVSVVFGGILVLRGSISLGAFVAFNSYLALLTGPIENLGKVVNQLQRGLASEKRILAVLNEEPDIADTELAQPAVGELDGDIEFRNLSFTYPGTAEPVLKNVNLKIPKGSTLAIVGKVGSGKSTLVHLLVRLYNPPAGTVFIDGRDIHEIPLQTLRGRIGIVPQDQFLFSSTIRDNISFDPNSYTEEEVEGASRIAQVYDNIVDFPNQFDTTLGERGVSLSGGQRQRVSIARAIIKKPSVLIFDDSLSAVDTITEDLILQGLNEVMENRTTIIIGHRISSVQNADQIIVLDEGRIMEQGTHRQLLSRDGMYAELYNLQLLEEQEEKKATGAGAPKTSIRKRMAGGAGA